MKHCVLCSVKGHGPTATAVIALQSFKATASRQKHKILPSMLKLVFILKLNLSTVDGRNMENIVSVTTWNGLRYVGSTMIGPVRLKPCQYSVLLLAPRRQLLLRPSHHRSQGFISHRQCKNSLEPSKAIKLLLTDIPSSRQDSVN